jgi:integrase
MGRRNNGEGAIRQKRKNLWEGRIVIGHKNDGSSIFKYVYAKNKKDIVQKLQELSIQYRNVDLTEDSFITLEDWLHKWLEDYMRVSIRENTFKKYEGDIKRYIIPHLGKRKISSLKTSDIQNFYNNLLKDGKSHNLVRSVHLILHQSLSVAEREKLIASNPTQNTKIPKKESKPKNILNENQLDIFMEAIKEDELWHDFFYTEITTGLRRGELCGLKWCDFNEEKGQLKVERSVSSGTGGKIIIGEPKTEKGNRIILLPPSTAKMLSERKKEIKSEWIFPNLFDYNKPILPSTAYQKLKSILKKAGLPNIRFHDLRHTFATHALTNGVDARTLSGILGHTNASFTLDTYTHVTDDMKKNASTIVGSFMKDIMEA